MTSAARLSSLFLLLAPLLVSCTESDGSVNTNPEAEAVDPFTAEKHTTETLPVFSLASGAGASASHKDVSEITYDQRQNGTQNVRLHLDDVTLIVAPSDGIASLFAGQTAHAFIQNAEVNGQSGAGQSGAGQSGAGQSAQDEKDPYADFDQLVNTANFLKSEGLKDKLVGGRPAAKQRKCASERCKAKRAKIRLTRYLLPILASQANLANRQEESDLHSVPANQ